jgi:predicted ATPase
MDGQRFLHFQVVRLLGVGEMGVVYEALDTKLERKVALKFLRDLDTLGTVAQARFAREAKVISKFDHPNIGTIYSFETTPTASFLVMALYTGQTLYDWIQNRPLDFATIVQFALEMAQALDHAHSRGVLHRDFKPANIFVAKDVNGLERIKVLDFGLSKLEESSQNISKANAMIGTLLYAAPEQLRGEFTDQSDVWAWGCVVYQMLTKIAPFDGENMAVVLHNILHTVPEPLVQRCETVPDALLYLVNQALEKNPKDRLQSVKALIPILEQCLLEIKTSSSSQAPTSLSLIKRSTLPTASSEFIGRETELEQLKQTLQLPETRLLSLVALGGMGKTRLALEAAKQLESSFRHGAAFVDLTQLDDAILVPGAILQVLELQTNKDPLEEVLQALSSREMLLVLDNFEHLMPARELVSKILEVTASIKILVTSRASLGLRSELFFELGGFPFPIQAPLQTQSSARLFLQSANKVQPDFAFLSDDYDPFRRIFLAVGGSPLGLSLAGTWVQTLEVSEIAQEVENSLSILDTDAPDLHSRQRGFAAVFASSWRYLTDTEQAVLAKLTLCRGGCNKDWAKRVAGASLPVLQSLIQKSLLTRKNNRYAIHELVRQFAEKELSAEARAEAMAVLTACCLELAKAYQENMRRYNRSEFIGQMHLEIDNLRAVLDWTLQFDSQKHARLLALIWNTLDNHFWGTEWDIWAENFLAKYPEENSTRLSIFWRYVSNLSQSNRIDQAHGLALQARAIAEKIGTALEKAEIEIIFWHIAQQSGEFIAARGNLQKALSFAEESGNHAKIGNILRYLGFFYYPKNAHQEENLETSLHYYQLGYACFVQTNEIVAINHSILDLVLIDMAQNQWDTLQGRVEEVLQSFRQLNETHGVIRCLEILGRYFSHHQQYQKTRECDLEALRLGFQKQWDCSFVLNSLAWVAVELGDLRVGLILMTAAIHLVSKGEHYYPELVAEKMKMLEECTKAGFTPSQIAQLEALGNVMTLEQAVNFAHQDIIPASSTVASS